MVRNADWKDGVTLYTHDMKISNNFDIEDNLGVEYFEKGDYKQAIEHFKSSYEMFPYEVNAYNVALVCVRQGDYKNAEKYFDKSLQAKDYAQTSHLHELGNYELYTQFLLKLKRYDKAIQIAKSAIYDYPKVSQLWAFLAYAEYQKGNQKSALNDVQKALRLDPNSNQTQVLYEQILQKRSVKI